MLIVELVRKYFREHLDVDPLQDDYWNIFGCCGIVAAICEKKGVALQLYEPTIKKTALELFRMGRPFLDGFIDGWDSKPDPDAMNSFYNSGYYYGRETYKAVIKERDASSIDRPIVAASTI